MDRIHTEINGITARASGKVQGVGFRAYVQACARILGLSGWVRNLSDRHTVEIVASGKYPDIETFLDQIRIGPPNAQVISVDVDWHNGFKEPSGFAIQ